MTRARARPRDALTPHSAPRDRVDARAGGDLDNRKMSARVESLASANAALCASRTLADGSAAMEDRFNALFRLRSLGTVEAVDALVERLSAAREPSALLRHEVAFALGQMRARAAEAALTETLADASEDGMVRHECAEALGAFADASEAAIEALERAVMSDRREVAETASLALRKLRETKGRLAGGSVVGSAKERASAGGAGETPYLSVDPVPALAPGTPVETLERILMDDDGDMYERYGAMFALRNASYASAATADACADVLGRVLATSASALLKHEVCYVLGQLQSASEGARASLVRCLEDASEHPMVRHEAAEALGSIAHPSTKGYLETYANDPEPIVAQSCEVALSIMRQEQEGVFVTAEGETVRVNLGDDA